MAEDVIRGRARCGGSRVVVLGRKLSTALRPALPRLAGRAARYAAWNSLRISWLFWFAIERAWIPSCCWVCKA